MTESSDNTQRDDGPAEDRTQPRDFGLALKQAREQAGLTVADVADELKLTQTLISDLESSRVEDLPASTFTQGYLRNYARLLKLPAEDIVQAYLGQIKVSEPDLTPVSGVPAQKSSRDALMRITSYGLGVVALLLMLLWWQQTDFDWDAIPVPESITAPETASESLDLTSSVDSDIDLTTDTENRMPPGEWAPDEEPAESTDESSSEGIAAADFDSRSDTERAPAPEADTTQSLPEEKPVMEVIEPEPAIPPAGDDILVLTTESESWTEVNDAAGQRLLFKLMEAGQQYQLKGQAPFRIFLGNAPSVSIRVNDQPVDIAGYIRSNNIANVMIASDGGLSANRRPVKTDEPAKQDDKSQAVEDTVQAGDGDSSRDSMFDDGQ